ncbi:hypothetical protein D3C71_2134240 [compost metagenome]
MSLVWNEKTILAAITKAMTAKTMRSTSPEYQPAISPPINVPATMNGAQSLNTSISSAPRF